ncbi:MAG: (Fe-S)-binding protein [Azospira sp.]|jgi:L-lactate dehydrogenase complex protein LldE|nr:(Fe-S)-binding protein [Azospira sp.]
MERDSSRPGRPGDVYFFATCLVDLFCPEAGLDAIRLLEREGIRVHFPEDQTCCGQPAYTSGYADEARQVARVQIGLFPKDWPVIVPSGSCAGMMRHHYPKLFAEEPALKAKAEALSQRVFELTEFFVEVLKVNWKGNGASRKVALHTSCSARREMGTHLHARALLGQLDNVELLNHAHEPECCGFGGTFAVRQPDISAAMAGDKADALKESGAEVFLSADGGCLMNIDGTLEKRGDGFRGQHLASFLWQQTQQVQESAAGEDRGAGR